MATGNPPVTTHQWLQPLYKWLKGVGGAVLTASGTAQASWLGQNSSTVRIGNATGVIGLYGYSGLPQVATGGAGIYSASYLGVSGWASTGVGNSGLFTFLSHFADNGGTGTPYTLSDVVRELKNIGALPL